jgi:hypothetical protein
LDLSISSGAESNSLILDRLTEHSHGISASVLDWDNWLDNKVELIRQFNIAFSSSHCNSHLSLDLWNIILLLMSCQHVFDVRMHVVSDRDVDVLFEFTEEEDWRDFAVFNFINVHASRIEESEPSVTGKLSIKCEVELVLAAISQVFKSNELCGEVHVVTFCDMVNFVDHIFLLITFKSDLIKVAEVRWLFVTALDDNLHDIDLPIIRLCWIEVHEAELDNDVRDNIVGECNGNVRSEPPLQLFDVVLLSDF